MRKVYVFRDGKFIDKDELPPIINEKRSDLPTPMVMQDIDPFVSPIDDKLISSRSQLRAHNITHNVRQSGELKGTIIPSVDAKRVESTTQGGWADD